MTFEDAAERTAARILELPRGTRWFIDCDTDADGLCGAAVMARALTNIGHGFQIRPSRGKTTGDYQALAAEACDGYILIDKGSSHLETLAALQEETGRRVIVVDHHNVPVDAPVSMLNPRQQGLDGSRDASAATTAVALATALGGTGDLAPLGLSGAIGDWQHEGGWQGYNAQLVDQGLSAGTITKRPVARLIGVDLADAWARRLQVSREEAVATLQGLQIDPASEPEDLDSEALVRVGSHWTLHELAAGRAPPKVAHDTLWNPQLDAGLRQVFRIVDACGRLGDGATGIAYLLGRGKDGAQARFVEYKHMLADAMAALSAGTEALRALQWTTTKEPALTGMVAGLGMMHALEDRRVPVLVRAAKGDAWQISTRGTHEQVAHGMDLGAAISNAARAVGAEGGGHPIASGAIIPDADWASFLSALDEALMSQGFLGDA